MKPALRHTTTTPEHSFQIKKDIGDSMINNWHYHPEIELLYLKKSSGTWLIGDHIGQYKDGDVVLVGANLPHCFQHEGEYLIKQGTREGEAICIKFTPEIFGDKFLDMPEIKIIKDLLMKCNFGLKLTGNIKNELIETIESMLDASPTKKLIYLLTILEKIAASQEYIQLSSTGFLQPVVDVNKQRIKQIFDHTYKHFNKKITINEVAAILNMTTQSFCRYFKNKTKKTYIKFLMEVRIGYACRLLAEDEKNVAEVCYDSGYNNMSLFNNQFKTITKKTPMEYKMAYLKIYQ